MNTKFFNNVNENTLFNKLSGIAKHMHGFDKFLAVAGYFRSSGYFKLRKELLKFRKEYGDLTEIKILVGINVDGIFNRHDRALLNLASPKEAKEIYRSDFCADVASARYSPEVEEGIIQMYDDLSSGRLEMRIHPSKNLHAKFYLCLPEAHSADSDGWVIMGSSNLSDSGLGVARSERYELNVAMKDYSEVNYCVNEFWRLWNESVELTSKDIEEYRKATHLANEPTPYEIYIKVLISAFENQIEDDYEFVLPGGVKNLKYQRDAAIQGYQMLKQHNGVFLADVVGLGKTMIAAMIAKRFVLENGRDTNILVVYPRALESNWKDTFKQFGLDNKTTGFITNGSLSRVLEGRGYKDKADYDLIIVDESHGFRNDTSRKYRELYEICKAPRSNVGGVKGMQKKVMLLSATPINNGPSDFLNQLLLFQDKRACTIEGIPNLASFFIPLEKKYKKLMQERGERNVADEVARINEEIRTHLINKVTVRRTRSNILQDDDYRQDIESNGVIFPRIHPPVDCVYTMDSTLSDLFYETLSILADESCEKRLNYARYRAVEFLVPEAQKKCKWNEQSGRSLAGIYRVFMVKRLESSFYAFKKSLGRLLSITKDMLRMFDADKVIIAPELRWDDLLEEGKEIEEIIEYAMSKEYLTEDNIFRASDFKPELRSMLEKDVCVLEELNDSWARVQNDPKFDAFRAHLFPVFLNPDTNPSGKLVLFSESADTLEFLYDRLTGELGRKDVLKVTASDRGARKDAIKENFDANCKEDARQYNIIITSDVLAEGVNLHRSNVIINYDSPWNATRLMQRVGRVNRIGSSAKDVYNYMFYPSKQGDKEIQLYQSALLKLQGFHSAYGEDAQIYSREEIVKAFKMFDNTVKDDTDERLELLREVQDLYQKNRKLYNRIKKLPMKSRVMRRIGKDEGKSLVYVSSDVKREFYLVSDEETITLDFLDAIKYLRAKKSEKAPRFVESEKHFNNVQSALKKFKKDWKDSIDTNKAQRDDLEKDVPICINFLKFLGRYSSDVKEVCEKIIKNLEDGRLSSPHVRELKKISAPYWSRKNGLSVDELSLPVIKEELEKLVEVCLPSEQSDSQMEEKNAEPQIIISETFI